LLGARRADRFGTEAAAATAVIAVLFMGRVADPAATG
jgi:hypothetical protein